MLILSTFLKIYKTMFNHTPIPKQIWYLNGVGLVEIKKLEIYSFLDNLSGLLDKISIMHLESSTVHEITLSNFLGNAELMIPKKNIELQSMESYNDFITTKEISKGLLSLIDNKPELSITARENKNEIHAE